MAIKNEYLDIFDELEEGVYFMDVNRIIGYWNRAAESISGYSAAEVLGRSCRDNILVHVDADGKSLCAAFCPAAASMQNGQKGQARVYLHHKKGHRVPVNVTVLPFRDANDQVIGVFEVFSDLSIKKISRETLQEYIKYSFVDENTGLFNKRYFRIKMNSILTELVQREFRIGLLGIKLPEIYDVKKNLGSSLATEYLTMIVETIRGGTGQDNALFFMWRDDMILVVLPEAFKNVLIRSAQNIGNLSKESFIVAGQGKVVPRVVTEWVLIEREKNLSEIEAAIDNMFV